MFGSSPYIQSLAKEINIASKKTRDYGANLDHLKSSRQQEEEQYLVHSRKGTEGSIDSFIKKSSYQSLNLKLQKRKATSHQ